jgi:Tol biopolymer transport system component
MPVNPPPAALSSTRFTTIALLLIASTVGAIALLMQRGLQPPGRAADRVLRQFTYHSGLQREPAWSPDGQSVAYTSDRAGNSDIWVQALTDGSAAPITTSSSEDSQPDWSPDGRWLVFRSERESGGLYVVPARGGFERKIASFGYQPRWSPDGSIILFSSSGHLGGTPRIYTVGLDGGAPQPLRPDLMATLKPVHVGWKPGGDRRISILERDTRLRFLTTTLDGEAPVYSEMSPAVLKRMAEAELSLERFVWSRSGRYLYFEGQSHRVRNLWRVTVDPRTLTWVDGPERLTTGASDDTDLALSPDGRHIVFTARLSRTRMWSYPFDSSTGQLTGSGEPVTSGGGGEQDADAIDDGSKLVYRVVRDGRQEVWERSIVDGREHLLISSPGWFRTRPRWSPDGTSIAYLRRPASGRNPRMDAVVAVLTTGGEERLLTRPGHVDLTPTDWSPDGRWLLGACRKASEPPATCVLPASTSPDRDASATIVTADASKNLFEQRFSPDQRWISFIAVDRNDAATSTIYIVPAAGGKWTAVTEGAWYDDKPHWAPDGRTLYFLSNREGFFNLWGRRIDSASGMPAGSPFRVTSFSSSREVVSQQLSAMQIAVTSRRLFLPMTETAGELWTLDHVDR